jgi:hypothetical protein
MMEAVSTSETFFIFYETTWHNIPEDSHLHTCHLENLKSVSKMLVTTAFGILTWLITEEGFIAFSHCESFKA